MKKSFLAFSLAALIVTPSAYAGDRLMCFVSYMSSSEIGMLKSFGKADVQPDLTHTVGDSFFGRVISIDLAELNGPGGAPPIQKIYTNAEFGGQLRVSLMFWKSSGRIEGVGIRLAHEKANGRELSSTNAEGALSKDFAVKTALHSERKGLQMAEVECQVTEN